MSLLLFKLLYLLPEKWYLAFIGLPHLLDLGRLSLVLQTILPDIYILLAHPLLLLPNLLHKPSPFFFEPPNLLSQPLFIILQRHYLVLIRLLRSFRPLQLHREIVGLELVYVVVGLTRGVGRVGARRGLYVHFWERLIVRGQAVSWGLQLGWLFLVQWDFWWNEGASVGRVQVFH